MGSEYDDEKLDALSSEQCMEHELRSHFLPVSLTPLLTSGYTDVLMSHIIIWAILYFGYIN